MCVCFEAFIPTSGVFVCRLRSVCFDVRLFCCLAAARCFVIGLPQICLSSSLNYSPPTFCPPGSLSRNSPGFPPCCPFEKHLFWTSPLCSAGAAADPLCVQRTLMDMCDIPNISMATEGTGKVLDVAVGVS